MSHGGQDLGQLAKALAGSANTLAAAVQASMASIPEGNALASAVTQLARWAQVFRDSVFTRQPAPVVGDAFHRLDAVAGQLNRYFEANPATHQIQTAWKSFAAIEVQTAQVLSACMLSRASR